MANNLYPNRAMEDIIKEGKKFIIKDEDSVVFKRQCVTKRVPI